MSALLERIEPEQVELPAETHRRLSPWIVVPGIVLIIGVVFRWRFGLSTKAELNADEAVVGLLADSFRHGRPAAFYPGQEYGGTLEAALVAGMQAVFGRTFFALRILAFVESVTAIYVVARLARRSGGAVAFAVAAMAVWPLGFVAYSVRELMFYNAGLLLGCGVWWLALTTPPSEARRFGRYALVGLLSGVAFWVTIQTATIILPCLVVVAIGLYRERHRVAKVAVFLTAALVGTLPWIARNINTGFRSLDVATLVSEPEPYWRRLLVALRAVLFIPFGDRTHPINDYVPDNTVTLVLGVAFVVLLIANARRLNQLTLAIFVLYPFISAINPMSASPAAQHRYVFLVWPALIMLSAQIVQLRPRLLLAVVVLLIAGVGVNAQRQIYWNELPHGVPAAVAKELSGRDIDVVLASYWDAYPIQYLCDDSCPRVIPFFMQRDTPNAAKQPTDVSYVLASRWMKLSKITAELRDRGVEYDVTPLEVDGYQLIHTSVPVNRSLFGGDLGP